MKRRYTLTTFEDRQKIEELLKKHTPISIISKMMERSNSSIYHEIKSKNLKPYTAIEAQMIYEKNLKIRARKQAAEPLVTDFENRICNLELQIEILMDKIKEITR